MGIEHDPVRRVVVVLDELLVVLNANEVVSTGVVTGIVELADEVVPASCVVVSADEVVVVV